MAEEKEDPKPAMTPAAAAREMARLRARVKELEEEKTPEYTTSIGSATEVYAGEDKDGGDLWHYKIDLPPSGGTDIKINGIPLYHGQQYKLTTPTLQVVKDMVARTWKHEDMIRGTNENFYRKPTERTLRGGQR